MPFSVQVTIDAASPHDLADWWAETLGWAVEPQEEGFIRKMIAEGHASEAETIHHGGHLVWREGAAINAPADSGGPRILFQLVPEHKVVKNRVHLDIRTGTADTGDVRTRLIERGATEIGAGRQGPHSWVILTDPEGNEFCV